MIDQLKSHVASMSGTLLFLGLLVSHSAFAHRDLVLPIAADGTMEQVPPEYGPASLQVHFAVPPGTSPSITSIVLTLGDRRVELPACVTGVLPSTSMAQVRASGSWHHDEEALPYYISIKFYEPGHDDKKWAKAGVTLRFNLRTGKVLKMQSMRLADEGRVLQFATVDLASRCTPALLTALFDNVAPADQP